MAGFFDDVAKIFGGGKSQTAKAAAGEFSKTSPITGFNRAELSQFMESSGSLASAESRVDVSSEGFGPQQKTEFLAASDKKRDTFTQDFTQDQVKGFISAFKQRQDEVFRRRAQPGISQTRLV